MADEADITQGTEPPKEPAAPAAGDKKPDAAKADGAKPDAAKAEAKAKPDDDDSGDPKPDEQGFVKMPFRLFMKRVGRMTKRQLVKSFGTDDVEAIVKEREELKGLRAEKEDRDRKAMSEKERLESDLKKAEERAEAAEAKAQAAEERVIVREQDRELTGIAGKVIDEEYVDYALDKMAKHIRANPSEIKKPKHAEAWLREFAEKHPKMARGAAEPEAEKKAEDKKKVPLDTGVKAKRPGEAAAKQEATKKHPRDMNRAELNAYAKEHGVNMP